MELWVRSQDKKTLSIAKNIKLDRYLGDRENIIISNDFYEIGKYTTEERALEVLDEIQNSILGILSLEDIEKQEIKKYTGKATFSKVTNQLVYIMPKE